MMEFFKGTVTRKDWMAVGAILGGTLAFVALFVLFVRTEQLAKLNSLGGKLALQRVDLRKAQATNANLAVLRADTKKVSHLVTSFESRLPDKPNRALLLKQFEALAAEVGLQVTLNSLDPVADPRKVTYPYSVLADGSFHKIATFINRLERNKRYLKISDLDIAKQKNGVAEAKFTLSTYSFKQPPPPHAKTAKPGHAAATSGETK